MDRAIKLLFPVYRKEIVQDLFLEYNRTSPHAVLLRDGVILTRSLSSFSVSHHKNLPKENYI